MRRQPFTEKKFYLTYSISPKSIYINDLKKYATNSNIDLNQWYTCLRQKCRNLSVKLNNFDEKISTFSLTGESTKLSQF